ncbi:MAG: hypothetical protein IH983_02055 [Planctomycetes bacterium]|nr:hypothetical protein [Planctomycetota bacterium]
MSQASAIDATELAFFEATSVPTTATSTGEAWAPKPATLALREETSAWLSERVDRLRRLLGLQENWDSYGAKPIDPRSVEFAVRLLTSLADVDGIEAPTVTASPDGNAALCWDDGHRSLDVEILADGSIEYAYLNDEDHEGTTLDAEDLAILLTQS